MAAISRTGSPSALLAIGSSGVILSCTISGIGRERPVPARIRLREPKERDGAG